MSRIYVVLLLLVVSLYGDWNYNSFKDKLSDEKRSTAKSSTEEYSSLSNRMSVGFECVGGDRLIFEVFTDNFITAKSETFKVIYRVDKLEPRTLNLITFSNSSEAGFTDGSVSYSETNLINIADIAKEFMNGSKVFIRVITWDNNFLEASFSLTNSYKSIKRVFSDCHRDDQLKILTKENAKTPKEKCLISGGNWVWNGSKNKWVCQK